MRQKLTVLFMLFLAFFVSTASIAQDSLTDAPTEIKSEVFSNLAASGIEGGAKFSWGIAYDEVDKIENLIIKYQKKVSKGGAWKYSPVIDAKTTSFTLDGMKEGEAYVWEIGCLKDGGDISEVLKNGLPESENLVWSKKSKYETERSWGVYKFLILLGSYCTSSIFICHYGYDGKFCERRSTNFTRVCRCYDGSQYWYHYYGVVGFAIRI
jgi:hypothetical protein